MSVHAHAFGASVLRNAVFTVLVGLSALAQQANMREAGGLIFLPAVSYDPGAAIARSLAVGDLNGDGKPDLVVTNICPSSDSGCFNGQYSSGDGVISVLLGNGDGTFQTAAIYDSAGGFPSSVALADVNADGHLDVLIANECAVGDCSRSTVNLFLGKGDGTLMPGVTYYPGGSQQSSQYVSESSIVIGDVNGDGKLDLVVTNQCGPSTCEEGIVAVMLGNGDGTFRPGVVYDSGGDWPYSVKLADVNGDHKPDIVVTNCGPVNGGGCGDGVVGVLLANGDGTFQPVKLYSSGGTGATAIAVADVNHDGKLDLVVANYCGRRTVQACPGGGTVGLLLGKGDGTFLTAVSYPSGGFYPVSVTVADLNQDGKMDLLVANSGSANIGVLIERAAGVFSAPLIYGSGGSIPSSLVAGDLNRDGKPDLVVANACGVDDCNEAAVGVLLNSAQTSPSTTVH